MQAGRLAAPPNNSSAALCMHRIAASLLSRISRRTTTGSTAGPLAGLCAATRASRAASNGMTSTEEPAQKRLKLSSAEASRTAEAVQALYDDVPSTTGRAAKQGSGHAAKGDGRTNKGQSPDELAAAVRTQPNSTQQPGTLQQPGTSQQPEPKEPQNQQQKQKQQKQQQQKQQQQPKQQPKQQPEQQQQQPKQQQPKQQQQQQPQMKHPMASAMLASLQGQEARAAQQQQKQGGKQKKLSPKREFVKGIHASSCRNIPAMGLHFYEAMTAAGHTPDKNTFDAVINLCSGQREWESWSRAAAAAAAGGGGQPDVLLIKQHPPPGDKRNTSEFPDTPEGLPDLTPQQLCAKADELFSAMQAAGVAVQEATYASMARVACISGDADKARAYAKAAKEQGEAVRLRTYQPALLGYALRGDDGKAREVEEELAAAGVDLTESEFALLLEAAAAGGTFERFTTLLLQMAAESNQLTEATIGVIQRFFQGPVAAAALGADARWEVVRAVPEQDGRLDAAGGTLQRIELGDAEWDSFAASITTLATKQEKRAGNFEHFIQWHDANGPYDVLVDGANVALFGQNFEEGGFNVAQLRGVWRHLKQERPDAKILLLLHIGRYKALQQNSPRDAEWLDSLRRQGSFYFAHAGSNDDWYWLYAAVRARDRGMLVSNDELRDHIFQLLRPKHFLKWKEHHIARYSFKLGRPDQPEFVYPAPYTACVQRLESGAWVLPSAEREDWVVLRPVPVGGGVAAATAP